jgi:hypothetical protein
MSHVQAIIFDRYKYSEQQAIKWLSDHNYHPMKLHDTTNFHRFRIREPIHGERYITKQIAPGIELILAFK